MKKVAVCDFGSAFLVEYEKEILFEVLGEH
jgi:hypothetical protein